MEKYQILPESLHSRALQHSLKNLDRELAGQSTDDPECIDGKWLSLPLLYCLHIERHENQPDDFNIRHLHGWSYGDMIIALAEKNSCLLYKAWQHLMRTRFQGLEERSALSKAELVDLTTPEPTHDDCSSNNSTPPIIDLVTPEPVPVVDLTTPEPGQLVVSVVDLSTPEPRAARASSSCFGTSTYNGPMSPPGAPAIDSRPPSMLTQSTTPSKAKSHHCWDGISLYHAFRTPIPSEVVLCGGEALAQGHHGRLCQVFGA